MYKNIFVYTNTNCRRRLLDTKKLSLYFHKNSFNLTEYPSTADLIVYVTCAYRNEITERCLEKIKEFQTYKADLIIAGCLPEIEEKKLAKIFSGVTLSTKDITDIDILFPNNTFKFSKIKDADAILFDQRQRYKKNKKSIQTIHHDLLCSLGYHFYNTLIHPHLPLYLYPSNKRFYHVRISWGCMGHCSYCGIKKAIGNLNSKPLEDCIHDFNVGIKKNYKHFIITADDVGAYGLDIGLSFPILLQNLLSIPGDYTISLQDFDPKWIVKYMDEFAELSNVDKISSINVALQSGSHKILNLMNRYSQVAMIKGALLKMKEWNPDMSLDTHFIIGFPNENNSDFLDTMNFVTSIGFDMGFIYRYSCKTGTKADKMNPKVPLETKIKRMNEAKKILKNDGYTVLSLSKNSFYSFYKK